MKAREYALAALAAGVLASGCGAKKDEAPAEAAPPPEPAIDLTAEEQAIRNRSGEWMNYANAKDAASMATKIFAPDGILIADEKAYRGPAAIQAKFEADFKEMPDALVSWTSDQVRVSSSGDFAIENGSFNFDPDGDGNKPAVQGTFSTTWTKVDGEWRVLSDAGGENVPEPAA